MRPMADAAVAALSGFGVFDPDQLGHLIDQLPVVLWSTDRDLRLLSRRGGGLALFGASQPPTHDERIGEFAQGDQADVIVRAHQAALRGEPTGYEVMVQGRTLSARVEPHRDTSGRIIGVVGVAFDITERRRAEDALRDSESRFRTIIESEPECVKLIDPQGRLLDINPAGLAMIEADDIEVVRGRPVIDIVAPAQRAAFLKLHRRVIGGGSGRLEFEVIGLKGKRSWLETHAVPLRDSSGAIQAVLAITRDISRRKIAELALVESEERFCKAFYANALPLIITRLKDGTILDANEAFTRLVNRGRDDILGRTTIELGLIDAARRATIIKTLLRTGVIHDIELDIKSGDGASRNGLLSLVLVEVGGEQCTLGTYRDITEAKRAEEQLRASRTALRSLATRQQDIREDERTRIAREIHDSLGQALTALKLQLSAAEEAASNDRPGLRPRLHDTTRMVDELVKTVRRLATDLRPPILDQLGLPAALEWLAQDFAKRTGIRCRATTQAHNPPPPIAGELGTALFRIVQEALTNVLRHAGATKVDVELGSESGCVTLEINDDGTGISESGMGPGSLGILGMRERAAALGGVLEVAPREAGGTRVSAWFPPQAKPPTAGET